MARRPDQLFDLTGPMSLARTMVEVSSSCPLRLPSVLRQGRSVDCSAQPPDPIMEGLSADPEEKLGPCD